MKTKSVVLIMLTGLVVNLIMANNAYAYLDPATGSILLQGVLAALAAIAVTVKLYWHRLLCFFSTRKTKVETERASIQAKQENSKDNKGS